MLRTKESHPEGIASRSLDVYLLPRTGWDDVLGLQQRLVYELSEEPRRRAALILCEHPPIITIGRQGSRQHIRFENDELRAREIETRWTNRGGGCWMQVPGQLAAYPIIPITPPGEANESTFIAGIEQYRTLLYQTIIDVLDEFRLEGLRDRQVTGVTVGEREIASVGVAVKNWVAYHGCRLNVCVPMDLMRRVSHPMPNRKMTCMFRELRSPVRIEKVRESFLHHFVRVFGFASFCLVNPPAPSRLKKAANVASGNR